MADKIDINSPVKIESDSKARVAFELMNKIDSFVNVNSDQKDKKYWFTLYSQCLKATSGYSLESILKAE